MLRTRLTILLAALLLPVLGLSAPTVEANPERRVQNAELPVAATCGPMQTQNVTHIMVLGPDRSGRADGKPVFLVAGDTRRYAANDVFLLLKQRAGNQRPSPHELWITAAADAHWGEMFKLMTLAGQAGLYRVGMRVQHPSGGVYGMPFFLPATVDETNVERSVNRLPLKVEQVLQPSLNADESSEIPLNPEDVGRGGGTDFEGGSGKVRDFKDSDADRVFQAAQVAIQKFGDVVVEIWIDAQVRCGYAIKLVDYLYRAGAAGVRIKSGRLQRRFNAPSFTRVRVVRQPRDRDVMIPDLPLKGIKVPTPNPRATAWPLHGANQPGALTARMLELPVRNEAAPKQVNDPHRRWVNHLRKGSVPDAAYREAAAWIRKWSLETGRRLLAGLRGQATEGGKAMVVRFSQGERFRDVWSNARRAFPDAIEVLPATLQFDVYLIDRTRAVGKATVTLNLVGDQLGYVFASWSNETIGSDVALPPEPVDLFAAGVPGAIRVWCEKAFADVKKLGARAFPLTPAPTVNRGLPPSAHAQVAAALAARPQQFGVLAQALGQRQYDRLLMIPREGSAAVLAAGKVVGVLRFEIESEEKELRVAYLTAMRGR